MKKLLTTALLVILSFTIFSQVEIGSSTDFTEIESDGTIEFHGDATVWNDYVVPMTSVKEKSLDGKQPEYEAFIGEVFEWNFINGKLSEVGFTIQMPHDWDGSIIYPHIHWSPEGGGEGTVVWSMEYTWINYGGESNPKVFPSPVHSTSEPAEFSSPAGDYQHHIAKFDPITPIVNSQDGISSIILIRFYRDAEGGTGDDGDTYDEGAFALSFDIHYRSNTAGSRQEYIK